MNSRELMIDDWYQWYSEGKYYYYRVKAEDFTKDYIRNFEPIPLTAEILELNRFKNIEEVSIYQEDGVIGDGIWQNDQLLCGIDNTKGEFLFYTFSVDPDDDDLINKIEKVIYVHELQRALRCCGLWDLANNFKII